MKILKRIGIGIVTASVLLSCMGGLASKAMTHRLFTSKMGEASGPYVDLLASLSRIPGPKMVAWMFWQAANGRNYQTPIVNGIGYSNLYPGSTFDVRANACNADAANLTNGNTTGVCDSTQEPLTQTIAAKITAGASGLNHSTVWRVGSACYWSVIGLGGSTPAIFQYSLAAIIGSGTLNGACIVNYIGGAGNVYALYETPSTGSYIRLEGMKFQSLHAGTSASACFNSGHLAIIPALYDNSVFANDEFDDDSPNGCTAADGSVVQFGAGTVCCTAGMYNIHIDGGNVLPAPLLDLEMTSTTQQLNGLQFDRISLGHNNGAFPQVYCHDTSSTHGQSNVTFTGQLYMEGPVSAITTAPFIESNGCGMMSFDSVEAYPVYSVSPSTVTVIQITNAYATQIHVGPILVYSPSSNATLPATAIQQNNSTAACSSPPCNISTDANGRFVGYDTGTRYFDSISIGGQLIGGNANGQVNYSASTQTVSATTYLPFGGGGSASTTEANVQTPVAQKTTFSNFYVQLSAAPGTGNTLTFTVRDGGVSEPITCTISGSSSTTCNDVTHTFNPSQGDLVDILVTPTGTVSITPVVQFAVQLGGGAAQVAAASLSSYPLTTGTSTGSFTQNTTHLYGFSLQGNLTTSSITYYLSTADNTSNDYDIGILCAQAVCGTFTTGQVITHIGATAGTTFSPSINHFSLNWLSTVTLTAGVQYAFGTTTNCASSCAVFTGGNLFGPIPGTTAGTTTGGVLSALTIPANNFAVNSQCPEVIFH